MDRLLGQRLRLRVQRGHDLQSASQQIAGIVALLELVPDVVDEVRRQRGPMRGSRLLGRRQDRPQIHGIGLVRRRRADVRVAHHRIQHVTLPGAGMGEALGQEGIQVGGALWQAGHEARLGQVEPASRGPEVGLRRRLDPEGLIAIEDGVEVHLEDLVLGVLPLQLDRQHQLARLAIQTAARRTRTEKIVFDKLLRDGAAALRGALVHQVVNACGQHPDRVDGPVVVEVFVFDRDRRMAQVPRDLAERDHGPPLLVALLEEGRAIASVDAGGLRQVLRAQMVQARHLAGIGVEKGAGADHDGQQADPGHQ